MAISRDYTKEVGLPSTKKNVPRPLAFIILALVAGGAAYGVMGVLKHAKQHHPEKPAASAAASP